MRYRRLGSSDLEISEISLGSWLTYGGGVAREQAEACVAKAFEVGIDFIDTANGHAPGKGALSRLQRVGAGPDPGCARATRRREVRVEPAPVLDPLARAGA